MKPLRVVKIVFAICLILMLMPAQANHVKCSCPNVNARATGSTSCSASESNGQCTVAFNEFDKNLELSASALLQRYSQNSNIQFSSFPAVVGSPEQRGFTQRNAIWLSRQSRYAIVDQIMVYAMVTLVQSGNYKNARNKISVVHQSLRRNTNQISQIFTAGGQIFQNDIIQVKHGCFAFVGAGLWGMYKASWSPSIGRERC